MMYEYTIFWLIVSIIVLVIVGLDKKPKKVNKDVDYNILSNDELRQAIIDCVFILESTTINNDLAFVHRLKCNLLTLMEVQTARTKPISSDCNSYYTTNNGNYNVLTESEVMDLYR